MSGDSFSVLIKTEQEATEIIQGAKEKRKLILKEHERALEKEIEQYREEEYNRIKAEQATADTQDGTKGAEEEAATTSKINEIKAKSSQNMDTMVHTLVTLVTSMA
eukprot:Rhum_TRINITY_DN213_c0_g1::Rhum_TRINITY_DN213_c0_g1_i1::g.797::m.797/K02152/ATPeV1G, ATP6G; V-type H+-transporting ATPase subunit G